MQHTVTTTQQIQEQLETKQTELQEHIARLELVLPSIITATERQVQESILANERVVLAQVEVALHRLAGGTYGYCIDCARAIPEERLKAKPWAIRCVEDEERSEEREREVKSIVVLKPYLHKLTNDLRYAAASTPREGAILLVNMYYQQQAQRIRLGNQIRAMEQEEKSHLLLDYYYGNLLEGEKEIQKTLDAFSIAHPIGQWLRSVPGIGPTLASGLLAHIDINKAVTAGHIHSFAGLTEHSIWLGRDGAHALVDRFLPVGQRGEISYDLICDLAEQAHRHPRTIWKLAAQETGKVTRTSLIAALAKRPWNAELKKICYLVGMSFVKVQNNERDIYGKMYVEHKRDELRRNNMREVAGSDPKRYEAIVPDQPGEFAEQARVALQKKRYGKETEAYKWYIQGMLPPAQIDARARRACIKMFLSHLHAVWFEWAFQTKPVAPYPISRLGHVHYIPPPNWPMQTIALTTEELITDIEPLEVWEDEEGAEGTEEMPAPQLLVGNTPGIEQKLALFKAKVEQRRARKYPERLAVVATVWGKRRTVKVLNRDAQGNLRVLPWQRFPGEPQVEVVAIRLEDVIQEHQEQVREYLGMAPSSRPLIIMPRA